MSASARIFALQSNQIHHAWHDAVPFLRRALERSGNERTLDYVLEELRAARAQLWCAMDDDDDLIAAAVTRIEAEGACRIWLLGGKGRASWLHGLTDHIEPWARSIGCTSVRINGRKGWQRVLPGYRRTSTSLEKDLGV